MTIETVTNAIKTLEDLDHEDEFAYESAFRAFQSVKSVPVIIDEVPTGTAIIRSRFHDGGEELFKKISDISTAPNTSVKSYARCNKPSQGKFYGSENRPTSYIEQAQNWVQGAEPGDRILVTLGQWITQSTIRVVIVASPDKHMRILPYDVYYGNRFDETINDFDRENREAATLFYRFLFEKFRLPTSQSKNTYIITTAYCNLSLHLAQDRADGVMYPSVQSKVQGINFALNQKFATHDRLKLNHVIRNEMTAYLNEDNKMSFRETGILHAKSFSVSENRIEW